MKTPRWLELLSIATFPVLLILIASIISQDHEAQFFFLHYKRQTPEEAFLQNKTNPLKAHRKRGPASIQGQAQGSPPSTHPCTHLYSFICEDQTTLEDPTGILETSITGDQAAQNLLKSIRKHNPGLSEDALQEKLTETIFNPVQRKRIESAFIWVKREMLLFFEQQPDSIFSPLEKMRLKSILMATSLQIPPPAQVYRDHIDLLMSDDVFYEKTEQGARFLKVGGGYVLVSQSWFNLIFTLAHELAHSIDICEIKDDGLSFPAFDRLNACFLEQKLVSLTPQRLECVSHDHLAEVFADWIAVQITGLALKTFKQEHPELPIENAIKNSVRDLCFHPHHELWENPQGKEESEFHPTPQIRVEKLFAQHPLIRELLGCPSLVSESQSSFCTWNNPP